MARRRTKAFVACATSSTTIDYNAYDASATTATTPIDYEALSDPTFQPALRPFRLNKGPRGPQKRDPREDPDRKYFDEITRFIEKRKGAITPYRAVDSLVHGLILDGKIDSTAKPKSIVLRIYKKYMDFIKTYNKSGT